MHSVLGNGGFGRVLEISSEDSLDGAVRLFIVVSGQCGNVFLPWAVADLGNKCRVFIPNVMALLLQGVFIRYTRLGSGT